MSNCSKSTISKTIHCKHVQLDSWWTIEAKCKNNFLVSTPLKIWTPHGVANCKFSETQMGGKPSKSRCNLCTEPPLASSSQHLWCPEVVSALWWCKLFHHILRICTLLLTIHSMHCRYTYVFIFIIAIVILLTNLTCSKLLCFYIWVVFMDIIVIIGIMVKDICHHGPTGCKILATWLSHFLALDC